MIGSCNNMLFKKINTALDIILVYINWMKVYSDRLGFSKGNYVCKLRNGLVFKVRSGEGDINIINEVFISKSYHTALKFIKKDSVVIDIGAHIGSFSILAGKIAKQGKIYSYEPFIGSDELLKENVKLNNLDNVWDFNLAVNDKPNKKLKFYLRAIAGEYSGNSIYGSGKYIEVNSINLEQIFKKNKIKSCDLLKIDCEGAEYNIILKTPKKLFKNINNIILEYHEGYGNPRALKDYLTSLGFQVTEVTKGVYLCLK